MGEKNQLLGEIPLPRCTLDNQGKISSASEKMDEVFLYDGILGANIFALTGIKYEEFVKSALEEDVLLLKRNKKTFKILSHFLPEEENEIAMYFLDITRFEEMSEKYYQERPCVAVIEIDNYDELIADTEEVKHAKLKSKIDGTIRKWAKKMEASVTKANQQTYFIVFREQYLAELEVKKFEILDQVRTLETSVEFPITLSIGVGIEGETMAETDDFAMDALDAAKGRGGDQAVVKKGNELDYYGGTTQTVEKGNKGKSRIIGQALRVLANSSSKVLIMGHRNPDMDAFGAALGVYRLVLDMNKETYIVVDQYNEGLEVIYGAVKETDEYNLINNRKALSLVDNETLVIVVDTHRPSFTECPDLLKACGRSVVLDHHRKGEEFMVNPILAYTEPYASSTAELVTEMLQFTVDRKNVKKIEAEGLLAGMTVDTNRFSVKTGVRTFEAAAWLKRAGADMAEVKRFFQTNITSFKIRAKGVSNADIREGGLAFSVCEGENENAQIINSQIADELLTVRGIRGSFVAGRNENGKTVVSARSIGNLNVHLLMEKLGGGGHLNTAGAQVDFSPEEAIEKIKENLEEQK